MSDFDKEWLTLREPADRRARDARLLSRALNRIGHSASAHVLDIGCGTGSTYRTLSDGLTSAPRWTLFDHDAALLAEAERRHGGEGITFRQGDLNDLSGLPIEGATLVTASALFDLCSPAFIDRFVGHLKGTGAGLYAALNYDGEMTWTVPHPLDGAVTAAFNDHQRSDKGFGISAGPDAWRVLAEALQAEGFEVMVAASPWQMDSAEADLQELFLQGVADAVAEQGTLGERDLEIWHRFRVEAISGDASLCRVGHRDVLAFP